MVTKSKILVAGGSGFIGKNLINDLLLKNNKIISISKNSNQNIRQIKNVKYIYHDLTKPLKKNDIKHIKGIDYIINCSGYVDHTNFSNGGISVMNEHFESLYYLTNLAIDLGVKSFIHIGSSDEYGSNPSPIKETIRESPLSPYALGKLSATHYLQQCSRKKLLNTIILRPFLVFGEWQNKKRFLPYLIDNCLNDRKFNVSNGEQIRDYLYVKDFNRALIKSLNNKRAYGEVINIASGIPVTIKEVINTVRKIIGKGQPIFGGMAYREGESMELYADIKKAKKILNWQPEYEFKESLKKVINWYSNNV